MELPLSEVLLFSAVMALVAALYSSVGHGGASGYLAVMSFLVLNPSLMSTTALMLNVMVAGIGAVQFARAGHFSWNLAWPFLVLSVPAAFLGGYLEVSAPVYFALLAAVLLFAAFRLIRGPGGPAEGQIVRPSSVVTLGSGAGIGLLSGVVGVGGGIFLSPLMILMKWSTTKQAAAISAFFIVVNSVAGLGGRYVRGGLELGAIWPFVVAAAVGGMVGSSLGAGKLTALVLRRLLGVVLLVAAFKLVVVVVQ